MDDERVDVRITSVRFIGGPGREGTSYGPEPVREPRWIRFADLRSFEFPKAEFEYRKFYGTAAPATLEIQGLRLVDGDVLPVEPVRVYQESFLNPGFQPAD